ncbi:MAG TPA: sugar-binding domain-containing protein [Bacillota bacterium]|nr:sugar-binding domain-containing protein [Bacillota bacterium]
MENLDIQKLVEISRMYYNEHMTQEVISKYFSISRSAVSLCLAEAKNVGIVQIQINDPSQNNDLLGERMEKEFGLKKCIVVPSGSYNTNILVHIVVSQAVRYALTLLKSHSCIGISWGNSCYEFMHTFPEDTNLCDITVVPLIGISPLLTAEYQLNESVRKFAGKLRGNPLFIYSPGYVENLKDKELIMKSDFMQPIFKRWQDVDFAVVGIGREQQRSEMRQYLCEGESLLQEIYGNPEIAVGDICARQFNIRGEFIENDHNSKLIGADKEILGKINHVMAIAAGHEKVIPIIGALRTGIVHSLATDENTVIQILDSIKSLPG